jgi:hypothetical protein
LRRINTVIGACCIALSLSLSGARGNTVTLVSGRDNTLYQDPTGSLSNGAGQYFFSGTNAAGLIRRSLVWFDLSPIPAGSTINAVSLTMHMSQTSSGASNVELHRLLVNWGEGTSQAAGGEGAGAPATPGDATWLHTFYNTSFWSNPGGDFDPAASAVTSVNAIGFYSWSSAGLVSEVQNWLNMPASNFGWLLKGDESVFQTSKRFDSRQNLTADFRPMLMIDYTPVPGPGGLAAWVVMVAMRGRRRR